MEVKTQLVCAATVVLALVAGYGLALIQQQRSIEADTNTTKTVANVTDKQTAGVTERVITRYAPCPAGARSAGAHTSVPEPVVVEVVKEVVRQESREQTQSRATEAITAPPRPAYALGVAAAWPRPLDALGGLGTLKWTITPEARIGRSNLFIGVPIVVDPANMGLPGVGLSIRMEF